MKRAFLLLTFALATVTAQAQTGAPLWTNCYNGPGNGDDSGYAIAIDRQGHVFVTGASSNGSESDYATVGYSNAGVPMWTNRYHGPGNEDVATAIAVDRSGNVIVTGYSTGSGSGYDYCTIKYSNQGVPLWTNRYDGPANNYDRAVAVAVDNSGNAFITGYSARIKTTNQFSDFDYATVAYSSAGAPLWTNRHNGPGIGDDHPSAIAVDSIGNVFVTGKDSGYAYATVAYSQAGAPLWTNRYKGPVSSTASASAMTVDRDGNVFVTGYSWNSNPDYATVAYSGTGVPLWTNVYNGSANGYDTAAAVAVDRNGNVLVTGTSRSGSNYDYATVAYSLTGAPLWTNRYNGPDNGDDYATAMAVDCVGNIFVTGYSARTNAYPYYYDYATLAYSNSGVPLWTNRYDGPGALLDWAEAMVVDSSGNVFVTGIATGSASSRDYATIKYSSSVQAWLDIQKVNDQVLLIWTNAAFGLQAAPAITGIFTNIPGTTSPYTNPVNGSQQFFRLISN